MEEKKMEAITENKYLIILLVKTYHNMINSYVCGMIACTHSTIVFLPPPPYQMNFY